MEFFNLNLFYHRHNQYSPFGVMSPNITNFYELTILLSGEMAYFIDDTEVALRSGDGIFVGKGKKRARREGKNADYISFNFYLDGDLGDMPLKMKAFADKEVQYLINAYDAHIEKNKWQFSDRLTEYLRLLLLKVKDFSSRAQFSPLTEEILFYLQKNVDKKLSLEDVGKYTHFSPIYCATSFKKEVGEPIIQYFNRLKIEQAKILLVDQLPLSRISAALGFEDYNYFTRLFKKVCGCSPSQYRNRFLYK